MTQLGKYELHEILGRGGFGTVYRAIDFSLNREVALKVLHPQLTTDPDFLERFRNEARLVASLKSPYIITIYELGEENGRVFIAMDYLPGGSLKQKLEKEGAITFDKTLKIIKQVCSGLEEAHEQGLVHRDVKPANILFDRKGNAILGDFGLARAIQLSSTSAASSTGGVGTPAYRAPELWRGKPPASPATDIYSLGCVLSEMLTGKVLFDGETPDEVITQHLVDGPLIPPRVPDEIRQVLEKALAKQAEDRYQDVAKLESALEHSNRAIVDKSIKVEKEERSEIPDLPRMQMSEPPPKIPSPQSPGISPPRRWSIWPVVGAVIGVIAILVFTIGGLSGWFSPKASTASPVSTEVPAKTETPAIATETHAATPTSTEAPVLGIGSTKVSEIDGMTLVYVPAGEFTMGSMADQGYTECQKYMSGCQMSYFEIEEPKHQVYLNAYWIDQTEVTNAMYEKCVKDGYCTESSSNSSDTRDSYYGNTQYADYPVIYVNWNQAQGYCEWAGRHLPTEAQWEKAARGTDGRTYPWGDETPDKSLANYGDNIGDTTEVGSYPAGASPYGALDMAGNVWEWVSDRYGSYPSGSVTDPQGPSTGDDRVLRGGSWNYYTLSIRSADRYWLFPTSTYSGVGFRCALSQ